MARPNSGPFGTISNLGRLVRTALVIDALLATGRGWRQIEAEVRHHQYEAHGLVAPTLAVVRRYFMLDQAPGLDPSYGTSLAYPAALALQYPEVRPMVVAPLIDLLFGPDLSKRDQAAKKDRFSNLHIKNAEVAGRPDDADLMRLLNEAETSRRPGRMSGKPFRPLWALYETLLLCPDKYVRVLFVETIDGFHRRIRPIEDELGDLLDHASIDTMAMMYGLLLEGLELADGYRVDAARNVLLSLLPALQQAPGCRRVYPIIERAIVRSCNQAVPRRFSRLSAIDKVRPASWWRDPGPFVDTADLMFAFPTNSDALESSVLQGADIGVLGKRIEACAMDSIARDASHSAIPAVTTNEAFELSSELQWSIPLLAFCDAVSASVPSVSGRAEECFWLLQCGTRCAVAAAGQDAFSLTLLNFDHVGGDPVTDRPIELMPWLLAERLWVDEASDFDEAVLATSEFLRPELPT